MTGQQLQPFNLFDVLRQGVAVAAGMSGSATAAMITSSDQFVFKAIMFGAPIILLILSIIVFRGKVSLTEEKHAEIVDELERTWGKSIGKNASDGAGAGEKTSVELAPGEYEYVSPVSGKIVPLNKVSDATFASGSMGMGVAIVPDDGRVYAPFDGIVQLTVPTRHAVGLVSDSGIVTLIHIGIGTVKLKGTGFVSYFERGQHVKKGDLLIEFWDPIIKKEGLDDTVIITILNSNQLTEFEVLKNDDEQVDSIEPLFKFKK